jgi:hypothetical protein
MTPLDIAYKYGLSFPQIDQVVKNAVKSIKKSYSFTGSYTVEDLYSTGWLGAISAINQPKFSACTNKLAYIFTFSRGYMTHALHRKSRMIKCPWEDIKTQKPGTAHLSYSWGNLPEAGAFDSEPNEIHDLLALISDADFKKILRGKQPSPEGVLLVNKIKELANA